MKNKKPSMQKKLKARRVHFELDGRVYLLDLFSKADLATASPQQGVLAVHTEVVDALNMISLGMISLAKDFKKKTGAVPEEFMKFAQATKLSISDARGEGVAVSELLQKAQKIWTPG